MSFMDLPAKAVVARELADPTSAARVSLSATYATGGEVRSKAKADGTDQTAIVQAELDALTTGQGGTLVLPSSSFGQVPVKVSKLTLTNDGTTPAKQASVVIRGQAAHWSGRGTAVKGGTILEFTGTDTYGLLKSNGLGLLAIEGVTFRNTGNGTTPFIYTTNTTLLLRGNSFVGSKTGIACDQDAIVLGGVNQIEGGQAWTDGFQGYGTVIEKNFFSGIRTAIKGQAFANAVVVRDNTVWTTCGNQNGAAIEWDGKPTTGSQSSAGCLISGNLIEVPNYKYAIRLKNAAGFTLDANNIFDNTAYTTSGYFIDTTCLAVVIREGFTAPGLPVLTDSGTGTKMIASSQGAYSTSGPVKILDKDYNTEIYRMKVTGKDSPLLLQPSETRSDFSLAFELKRSAAEATNAGASVYVIRQDGAIVYGDAAGGAGNITGPYSKFSAGGRTWSGVGTLTGQTNGSTMTQDSGPGGSYFDMKNYAARFYDHNGGPLRMRIGATKDGFDLGAALDVTVKRDTNAALAVNAPVKTLASTTAARPTPAAVGVGGQIFDTTLGKPIWSDGTNWKDATGTVV